MALRSLPIRIPFAFLAIFCAILPQKLTAKIDELGLVNLAAAGMQAQFHFGTMETVLATILVGAILGAWQGLWVVCVSVPSFVVTLSGLLAFRGIGYWVSNAQTIAPVSKSFSYLSEGFIPKDISYGVLFLTFVVTVFFLLRAHQRESRRAAG
jgi:D-xylose transport system permease protein